MNRIVIDASFCGAWILQDEFSVEAEALLTETLQPGGPTLMAPSLWTYEMLNLLRNAVKRKRLTADEAREGLDLIRRVPIQLIPPEDAESRRRILDIALLYDLTAYDAGYFELADRLQAPLKSGDRKLLAAYQAHRVA